MPFYEREKELLDIIMNHDSTSVNELLKSQYLSKSTLRRDLIKPEEKGLIIRTHGGIVPKRISPNDKIPFFLRENEHDSAKKIIAEKAVGYIHDGDTIMLDGTTGAYCIVPLLVQFKDIVVITSGAKASLLLGKLGIKNICTGGEMITTSFSYVGETAKNTISAYNADIVFFSCRGLSDDGLLSDNSAEENAVRRLMMKHSKKKIFLCNSDKTGNKYLNNLCHVSELDEIICEKELPDIAALIK